MKIEVIPGEIIVNAIALVRAEVGCRIYVVDFKSKRPAIDGYSAETGGELDDGLQILEVSFEADEETLRADPGMSGKPTIIRFKGLADDWKLAATVGKYTSQIFLWQDSTEQFREVWVSDD